jgi:preprotein translocase subunit YajC
MGEIVSDVVAQTDAGGGLLQMVIMIVPMLLVMYLFMIRPERKKVAEHAAFLGGLKRGDEVALNSGIIGKIQSVEERTLTIEIADKVRVRVLKQAVSGMAARYLTPSIKADAPAATTPAPSAETAKTDTKS